MATIQLLVTDDANRHALASVVEKRHTSITDESLVNADLYLVDDASLPRYQEPLDAHKHEQSPVFCPVVLIRREQTSIHVDLPPASHRDQFRLVNETLRAPVDQEVLFRRVSNLLVQRRQTQELQEQNERLEQFSSALRHEFRNPLQVLQGNIELFEGAGKPAAFERCQRAVRQMERLLEETLLITEEDEVEFGREPVDLEIICEMAWEMMAETNAELTVVESPRVVANFDRLEQLLWNLFRNAVDHGGNDAQVRVGTVSDGFYIEDDGPGIPESERETVFKEGYSTRGSGSGLGLAVVKAVADAHGWEVRICTGSEGGARFEFAKVELV